MNSENTSNPLAEQTNDQQCLKGWTEANHACFHTTTHKVSLQGGRNDMLTCCEKGKCSSHTPESECHLLPVGLQPHNQAAFGAVVH